MKTNQIVIQVDHAVTRTAGAGSTLKADTSSDDASDDASSDGDVPLAQISHLTFPTGSKLTQGDALSPATKVSLLDNLLFAKFF